MPGVVGRSAGVPGAAVQGAGTAGGAYAVVQGAMCNEHDSYAMVHVPVGMGGVTVCFGAPIASYRVQGVQGESKAPGVWLAVCRHSCVQGAIRRERVDER